jgi:hypothetical protein
MSDILIFTAEDAEDAEEKRLQAIRNAFDSVPHMDNIKVKQVTQLEAAQFQVAQ